MYLCIKLLTNVWNRSPLFPAWRSSSWIDGWQERAFPSRFVGVKAKTGRLDQNKPKTA